MLNYDEILQQKLSDLENGAALESVLQDLPAEARDLEALIRLAASVRGIPHPEPEASQVTAQREQVMAAAIRNTQPLNKTARPVAGDTVPAAQWARSRPAPSSSTTTQPRRIHWKWLDVGVGVGVAAAGAMMVLCAFILVGASLWLSNRKIDSARVENMSGQVQVATNKAGTQWKNVAVGYQLRRGARVRTLGASSATLVFFEGSRTFLAPNSDLTFNELNGSSNGAIQVQIDQNAGETWNKVTPLKGSGSFFLVHTPSGTASVHGTSFNVKVSDNGKTQFSVNTGVVQVKNDGSEVTLQAGQAASADPSGDITPPTYQFSILGSLTNIDTETSAWTVSGVTFNVTDTTVISGDPQLGSTVKVSGRILEDNSYVADTIEVTSGDDENAFFTGTLEQKDGDLWQVSGRTVKVTADTELDENLALGDPVKVTFNILADNTWLALKIESLVETPDEPTPTPTATSDPSAMPSYEFEPDEIEAPSCGSSDFNLTGNLRNSAEADKDYAANVQLGYLIDRGGEYVSSVELTPASWTRIDAGQTVNFGIHVTLNDKWASISEDSEIKLRIFVASATNRPDHLNGRLTVTIEAGCKATPTPGTATVTPETTETLSETPTAGTPTVMPTAGTPTPASTQVGQCTGANPHPTGMKLAQRYGVPYEEIMGWFCKHYGFGEIDMAYSLSLQSGKPVEEIFAMRASGMGWGAIKKQLQGAKNNDSKDNGNKGNGKNNKKH